MTMKYLFAPGARMAVALAALIGSAAVLSACGPAPSEVQQQRPASIAGALTVQSRTVTDLKPVASEITTRQTAEAMTRTGGTLIRMSVREGDVVRAGQVIGFVRDERTTLQTAGYDALVRAAEAESDRAAADLGRTQSLFEKGIYAQARLDQMRAAARAANGNLDAARAQRSASAELGAQGSILAPASGRVLKAEVPLGSVVMPGQSIATITSGPVVVRVQLPEGQAGALAVGQTVEFMPDGPGGAPVAAAIVQVYPAVEAGQVIADIDGTGLATSLVGRRISVRLPVGERSAIVIPRSFVTTRFGVDYVRLVRGSAVSDTPIQAGPAASANDLEILSGLVAGDRIVPPAAGRSGAAR